MWELMSASRPAGQPSHWQPHDARVDIIRVAAFYLSAQQEFRAPRNKADHRD
jgi:hypothetical protein